MGKINNKEFFTFFIIILLPNILRQVLYYLTFLKTNSLDFIDSFETIAIYNSFPFLGIIEEIIIGIVFSYLYFKYRRLRFLSYGWITDALIDYIFVVSWFLFSLTPLQFLGFNQITRFVVREILLSYVIFGPLLYGLKLNIKKLSFTYLIIGMLVLIIILF